MSIEVPTVEETTPVVNKPLHTSETTTGTVPQTVPETTTAASVGAVGATDGTTEAATESTPAAAAAAAAAATTTAEGTAKDGTLVEATPASEGVLGYKEPGFLKQFRFSKYFFWFNDEPVTKEALASYVRAEKAGVTHSHAAWAQETGKGVLFYAKRAEDKAAPHGLILLSEASHATKIGSHEFSFKLGSHTHKFEAADTKERDSWIVAIERKIEESKALKEDVVGRETYKKTLEDYAKPTAYVGSAAALKPGHTTSQLPKESTEAAPVTAATAPTVPAESSVAAETASTSSDEKKTKDVEKKAKKERSQSRKRNSIFAKLGKKEEDKDLKREEKAEKEEKKAEKEAIKEEKKIEAEHKKEEAKAEHDAVKAKEAAEAAAVAAVPAAGVVTADKEEKHEDTFPAASPTDKKAKRASVFSGFFGKRNFTSPTAEKSEKEAFGSSVTKDTEAAPKLDEPIENKPIDAAAVTGPVHGAGGETIPAESAVIPTEEAKKEIPSTAAATETATSPRSEKKSFLSGFIKKHDAKKEEVKEEKAAEEAVKDPLAAAAVTTEPPTTAATDLTPVDTAAVATTTPAVVEPATTTAPATTAETTRDERPAREKRRTSLFGTLGTLKRKTEKSPGPSNVEGSSVTETKREKSPLPSKLGGLFRKPSRAVKPAELIKEPETAAATTSAETSALAQETAATTEPSTTIGESSGSKIVGHVVPGETHTTVHDIVTMAPEETETKTTTA